MVSAAVTLSTVINVVSFTSLETQLSPLPTHCAGASIARGSGCCHPISARSPRSGQAAGADRSVKCANEVPVVVISAASRRSLPGLQAPSQDVTFPDSTHRQLPRARAVGICMLKPGSEMVSTLRVRVCVCVCFIDYLS